MIRVMVLAGMLLGSGMVFGQEVIAHWDFSKGKIDSMNGKFKMRFRGNTRISGPEGKQYLDVGINNKDKPEGIIALDKYRELTPKGAFRLEIKAKLREQTSPKKYLMLWDNLYSIFSESAKNGFAFFLEKGKRASIFRPQAVFGFSGSSGVAYGKWLNLKENEDFTIALEYDGNRKVSFFLNGKLNQTVKLKNGGSLAEAAFPAVIGDRFGSLYHRFDGQILEVKLTNLPSAAKK